eukprot:scaffold138817_cov17-Prasinocladus_malaysianus.AAC.1
MVRVSRGSDIGFPAALYSYCGAGHTAAGEVLRALVRVLESVQQCSNSSYQGTRVLRLTRAPLLGTRAVRPLVVEMRLNVPLTTATSA